MKMKKGKTALLAVASAALIASLVYDKKYKKNLIAEENKEKLDEIENSFIIK